MKDSMIFITEYMSKTKSERQNHLNLAEQCCHRGGNSTQFKGLLAFYLDTNIPDGDVAYLCHACNDGNCSNPRHLYWGTAKENHDDYKKAPNYKSFHDNMIEKHGIEKTNEFNRKAGAKGGNVKSLRKCKPKTIAHRESLSVALSSRKVSTEQKIQDVLNSNINFSIFGWVKLVSPILGVKDQVVSRWMKRNMPQFYEEKCYKRNARLR